ncbi:undecaprenyl-phosphate glucose phosphotransferase [Methylorubrum extorquens]
MQTSTVHVDDPIPRGKRSFAAVLDPDVIKLVDAGVIVLVGLLSGFGYSLLLLGREGSRVEDLTVALTVAAIFVLIGNQYGLYQFDGNRMIGRRVRHISLIWALTFLFLTAVAFGLKVGAEFSRGFILVFAATGLVAVCGARIFMSAAVRRAEVNNDLRRRPIYLLAPRAIALQRDIRISLGSLGLGVAQIFDWDSGQSEDVQEASAKDAARRLLAAIHGSDVEEIVIAADARIWLAVRDLLRNQPLPVRLIPDPEVAELVRRPFLTAGQVTLVEVQRGPLSVAERRAKRCLDIAIATSALVALLPLMAMVCIAIKLDSPGPVLFRQTRNGFNGRKFKILKFRSMRVQEDSGVVRQATRNDPRVTMVGSWLRRSSIDELPQLINVLRGEMSIVGPRPHAISHDTYYDKLIANYASRHHVKPGLTGWAQLKGFRGETRKVEDMARRVEHDIWYVDNCSVALDIRIIAGTFTQLVKTGNAY